MNQLIIRGYAVKTLESKETGAQRTKDGNAQFSLCCTSTAMPDDDRTIDIRHFALLEFSPDH
jgi:hypothetical protein